MKGWFAYVCKKHERVRVFSEWKPLELLLKSIRIKGIPMSDVDFREIECPECQAELKGAR